MCLSRTPATTLDVVVVGVVVVAPPTARALWWDAPDVMALIGLSSDGSSLHSSAWPGLAGIALHRDDHPLTSSLATRLAFRHAGAVLPECRAPAPYVLLSRDS